jgi:CRISPR-associated endonuclease/helicase Cas3
MTDYWAHSDPNGLPPHSPGARWQLLSHHLENTATLAAMFAHMALPAEAAFARHAQITAILHDIGKYSPLFQKLLRGEVTRAPHSAHGAAVALDKRFADAAFVIAGHHAGLPDKEDLKDRLGKVKAEVASMLATAAADSPAVAQALAAPAPDYRSLGLAAGPRLDLWIRMLFSCLIDADRTDTARSAGQEPPTPAPLDPTTRLARLLALSAQRAAACEEGPVKSARAAVLQQCLAAASILPTCSL